MEKIKLTASEKLAKKWNNKFKSLTKQGQRIAIARDVLFQIKVKKYGVTAGTYVYFNDEIDGYSEADVQKNFDKFTCNCCALGACILSLTKFNDKFTFSDISSERIDIWNELAKFFPKTQLVLIEYAFEGWSSYDSNGVAVMRLDVDATTQKMYNALGKCKSFYEKYADFSEDRFVAIMKNIIKNNGTFKP